jgi:hypothetical protein
MMAVQDVAEETLVKYCTAKGATLISVPSAKGKGIFPMVRNMPVAHVAVQKSMTMTRSLL